jgi:hypothetical protein
VNCVNAVYSRLKLEEQFSSAALASNLKKRALYARFFVSIMIDVTVDKVVTSNTVSIDAN